MRSVRILTAIGLLIALTAPGHAKYPNRLLGHWKLVKGNCAQRAFQFNPDSESVDEAYAGFPPSHGNYRISYNNADPKLTYVLGNTGIAIGFKWLNPNRVLMDTVMFCEYQRG